MAFSWFRRYTAITVPAAAISGDTGRLKSINLSSFPIGGDGVVTFTVKNTHATVAFDAFQLQTRTHPGADWETLASSAAQFTTALVAPLRHCSASPVTLAAAAKVTFSMDVDAFHSVRLMASGNAAASTAEVAVGVRG